MKHTKKPSDTVYTIRIVNWDKWQPERRSERRNWVAISTNLIHDPAVMGLTTEQRWAWVALLLHAGCVGPEFQLSPSRARVLFQLRHSCDFSVFADQGLITINPPYKTGQDKTEQDRNPLPPLEKGGSDPASRGLASKTVPPEEPPASPKRTTPLERWGPAPDGVDPDAWSDWVEYKRGTPGTGTVTKLANFLSQYGPAEQRQIVDQSIGNGWKGLFPPKGGGSAGEPSVDEVLRRLRG